MKAAKKVKRDPGELLNMDEPICIICRIHGKFWETPTRHLAGWGCPTCDLITLNEKLDENRKKTKNGKNN